MNDKLEKLLQPVSAEQPCGADCSNSQEYDDLLVLLKGKPETVEGDVEKPAEPPDWVKLQNQSEALLQNSRHLRVAVLLCCSLLKTAGLGGFRDGLQFLRSLIEQHWVPLHPQLDPEDNNDPTQRINILKALTEPRGAYGLGWLTFLDYLQTAPVRVSDGLAVPFEQLPATGVMETSWDLPACCQAIEQSLEAVQGIDDFLTKTFGNVNTISFEQLKTTLNQMHARIRSLGGGTGAETGAATESSGAVAAGAIVVRGSVRTRDDVVRQLDLICEYYRQVEPGSPVPYLLHRAQKLAKMDFVQVVQELGLGSVDALRPSMGSAVGGETRAGDAGSS